MLEEQSDSQSQGNIEKDAQTESLDSGQDYKESYNQEKVYSQKQRQRARKAEAELEKVNARNKKMEEDSLIEQNKYKELWENDKADAEENRSYKKNHQELKSLYTYLFCMKV